jgi:hypothetical protein
MLPLVDGLPAGPRQESPAQSVVFSHSADDLRSYTNAGFPTFYADFFMLWEWYTGKKFQNTVVFRFAKSMKRLLFRSRSRGNVA